MVGAFRCIVSLLAGAAWRGVTEIDAMVLWLSRYA